MATTTMLGCTARRAAGDLHGKAFLSVASDSQSTLVQSLSDIWRLVIKILRSLTAGLTAGYARKKTGKEASMSFTHGAVNLGASAVVSLSASHQCGSQTETKESSRGQIRVRHTKRFIGSGKSYTRTVVLSVTGAQSLSPRGWSKRLGEATGETPGQQLMRHPGWPAESFNAQPVPHGIAHPAAACLGGAERHVLPRSPGTCVSSPAGWLARSRSRFAWLRGPVLREECLRQCMNWSRAPIRLAGIASATGSYLLRQEHFATDPGEQTPWSKGVRDSPAKAQLTPIKKLHNPSSGRLGLGLASGVVAFGPKTTPPPIPLAATTFELANYYCQ
nr:hypothetical protein TRUBI_g7 [Trichoderma rubi]